MQETDEDIQSNEENTTAKAGGAQDTVPTENTNCSQEMHQECSVPETLENDNEKQGNFNERRNTSAPGVLIKPHEEISDTMVDKNHKESKDTVNSCEGIGDKRCKSEIQENQWGLQKTHISCNEQNGKPDARPREFDDSYRMYNIHPTKQLKTDHDFLYLIFKFLSED